MTDETNPIEETGEQPVAEEHPELAAIADSLETEADEAPEAAEAPEETAEEAVEAPEETAPEAGESAVTVPEVTEVSAVVSAQDEATGDQPEQAAPTQVESGSDPAQPGDSSPVAVAAETVPRSPDEVSWWPFLAYLGLWLIFAGVVIWRFYDLPAGQAVYDSPLYPVSVYGGVALTIVGPLLAMATWVAAWGAPGSSKWGQFVSALVKASVVTLGGVTLWWIALVIVDQLRLGRVL